MSNKYERPARTCQKCENEIALDYFYWHMSLHRKFAYYTPRVITKKRKATK